MRPSEPTLNDTSCCVPLALFSKPLLPCQKAQHNDQPKHVIAGIRFSHTCLRKLYVLSSRGIQDDAAATCLLEVATSTPCPIAAQSLGFCCMVCWSTLAASSCTHARPPTCTFTFVWGDLGPVYTVLLLVLCLPVVYLYIDGIVQGRFQLDAVQELPAKLACSSEQHTALFERLAINIMHACMLAFSS